jgi:hypothetical protein
MTTAPAPLVDLGRYWTKEGGVMLGIVGNAAHTSGYHLGRDRIYDGAGPGLGAADYSVQLNRDKLGLTNAAAAIDLGKLDGSLVELRRFSRWLVSEATHKRAAYRDVREIIYSPDGKVVQRWSGVDNKIHSGAGNGDSSHLTHTHISFYRDSEHRPKVQLFAPYFAPLEEIDDMPPLTAYLAGYTAGVKATANVRTAPHLSAPIVRVVAAGGESWPAVVGWTRGDVDPDGGSDQWLVRWFGDRWEYTAKSNVTDGPSSPTAPLEARIKRKDALASEIIAT